MQKRTIKKQNLSHSTDHQEPLIADDSTHDLHHLYVKLKINNEALLEFTVDAAVDGIWSLDLGTRLFWATEKTKEIFGFPETGEITFEHFLARIHPDDISIIHDSIDKVLHEGVKLDIEYRLLSSDGSICWVNARGAVYRGVEGESTCIIGVSFDITDRKIKEFVIARQLKFESLLAEISADFARYFRPSDLDKVIDHALGKILNFIGGDRCVLIKLDLENRKTVITNAYYREELEPVSPDLNLVPLFPWSFNLLKEGRCHCFTSLDELPPEAAVDRSTYEAMGVISSLRVPIFIEGNPSYLLIINSLSTRLSFSMENLPRLQIFGEVFTNAILRKKAEEKLRKSYDEIAALKEKLEIEANYLRAEVRATQSHEEIIGQSEPLKNVLTLVEQVAPTSSTVLVCGETGTGKELIAHAIHNCSPRRHKLMVKVNCASLPSSLVESELFGRERGAYTGALTRQIGRFELADGSTLFLDEISELSLELQAKLLRVLQEGEFERLGSPRTIKVDVRVITASNRNLHEEIRNGRFREDLFYRLNVFPIVVPPLRERFEDLPMLVWEFVREFNEKMGKRIRRISKKDMNLLQSYSWPGNIRELRNVIEHAVIVSSGDELTVRLPENSRNGTNRLISLEEMERRHIQDILRQTGGRIKGDGGAAHILDMNPATLYSRMKKLGISSLHGKDAMSSLG